MKKIEFIKVDRLDQTKTTNIKNMEWPFDELPIKGDSIFSKDERSFTVLSRSFNVRDSIVTIFIEE